VSEPVQLGWVARVFLAFIAICLVTIRVKSDTTFEAALSFLLVAFVLTLTVALAVTAAVGRLPWW
jgi:hypothetical protein